MFNALPGPVDSCAFFLPLILVVTKMCMLVCCVFCKLEIKLDDGWLDAPFSAALLSDSRQRRQEQPEQAKLYNALNKVQEHTARGE